MNTLFEKLRTSEIDVEGALYRLCGDEALYLKILKEFPRDPTMKQLGEALKSGSWDDAFTAAHALKGLAANLGFATLYYNLAELVINIRTGRIDDTEESFVRTKRSYDDIVSIINAPIAQ